MKPADPVPTPGLGIESTVQRGLTRMQAARIKAIPFDGPCRGYNVRRTYLLGACYCCANFDPLGDGTMTPRVESGAQCVCLDHVPVHGRK